MRRSKREVPRGRGVARCCKSLQLIFGAYKRDAIREGGGDCLMSAQGITPYVWFEAGGLCQTQLAAAEQEILRGTFMTMR
jgi:hypothetical protein